MRRRTREPEGNENHERWLVTYSDLITLLMIFFVVMYSISNVNAKKFAQLSSSLSNSFPSNWDLSTKRAINVVEFLINNTEIRPEKLSVVGYGEYRPVVPNDTEVNKARNRRVDIVVLKQALNLSEAGNISHQAVKIQ